MEESSVDDRQWTNEQREALWEEMLKIMDRELEAMGDISSGSDEEEEGEAPASDTVYAEAEGPAEKPESDTEYTDAKEPAPEPEVAYSAPVKQDVAQTIASLQQLKSADQRIELLAKHNGMSQETLRNAVEKVAGDSLEQRVEEYAVQLLTEDLADQYEDIAPGQVKELMENFGWPHTLEGLAQFAERIRKRK